MGVEIERKFLVTNDSWRDGSVGVHYLQGYMSTSPSRAVRVRIEGDVAFFNIKGPRVANKNLEYEQPVDPDEAREILDHICEKPIIDKTRYKLRRGELTWEIDEFHGENAGLVVAEVELKTADQEVELPDFIGEEVSDDKRYRNINLVSRPYRIWKNRAAKVSPPGIVLGAAFEEALLFATRVHGLQFRKGSGVPYVAHLLGVASLVLEHGGDEEQAIAALLHDAVEDQGGLETLNVIRERFGDRVADIVNACSDCDDEPKPPWRERKQAYIKQLGDAGYDVALVAQADKLYNLRTIVADYRVVGESFWERFTAPKAEQLWYYRTLASTLHGKGHAALEHALEETTAELERLASS